MKNILFIVFFNFILNYLVHNENISKKVTFFNLISTAVLIVVIGTKYLEKSEVDVNNTIDKDLAYSYPLVLSVVIVIVYLIVTYLEDYKDLILKVLFFTSIVTSLIHILPYDQNIVIALTALWFLFDYLTPDKHLVLKVYVNNSIAILAALSSINIINIDNVNTGIVLLVGLFLFDIFWVFGSKYIMDKISFTNTESNIPSKLLNNLPTKKKTVSVMEKIATNVNAPVLLKYFYTKEKTMILGLGDIVIPAIFIKTLVDKKDYYNTAIVSYIFGLVSAIYTTIVTKKGQPALLYIVPALIIPVYLRNKFTDNKIL